MATEITQEDEGKPVVRENDTLGRIVNVEHGTAYVDPDPSVTDTIMSKLGWSDETKRDETHPLADNSVVEVTSDEVRVESDL
ncbi:PRC-barrel domain containing protein [Halorientalis brevis]|uniref:PRC-barrel domain containing protein n=1 Tax=Halorientalis brevis TaxID=1126241 RepID=A0ABD6CDD7_9EURY|nr:PRC-barrel domain containing protein [Halorientalis brevis]